MSAVPPDPTVLAARAQTFAPDLRSMFLRADAVEFLEKFETRRQRQLVIVTRGRDVYEFRLAALRAFAAGDKSNPVVGRQIRELSSKRMWGRKLAATILASAT